MAHLPVMPRVSTRTWVILLLLAAAVLPALGAYPDLRWQKTYYAGPMAWSTDSTLLAIPGWFGTVTLYDPIKDCTVKTLYSGHRGWIRCIAWSPDDHYVATGSDDCTARLCRTGSDTVRVLSHDSPVRGVAFSPDGQYLVTASGKSTVLGPADCVLRLWRVSDGRLLCILSGHTDIVNAVAFSPCGRYIYSVSNDATLGVWDVASGTLLWRRWGHTGYVTCLAVTPDGNTIATGSTDRTIRLWQGYTGLPITRLTAPTAPLRALAYSRDGCYLASSGDEKAITIWDTSNYTPTNCLPGHTDTVWSLGFPAGNYALASGCLDGTVRLWAFHNATTLRMLCGTSDPIKAVAYSPDKQFVAAADFSVTLWRACDGAYVREFRGPEVEATALDFSPDGKYLAVAYCDKKIRVWRVGDGALISTLFAFAVPLSVAYAPDGLHVAAGYDDNAARLWRVPDQALMYSFVGHQGPVNAVAFSPDGRNLVTGSSDASVRLWRVNDGLKLACYTGALGAICTVAWSPDGRTIASAGQEKVIRLWNVATSRLVGLLEGHDGTIRKVAYTPNGRYLASCGDDKTVRIWRTRDGDLRQVRCYFGCAVTDLAFSADSCFLATGSGDGVVLWDALYYQPDVMVTLGPQEPCVGDNIYHELPPQTVCYTLKTNQCVYYTAYLENDGNDRDTFVLRGTAGQPGACSVRYWYGDQEITREVTGDGWCIDLCPGEYAEICIGVILTEKVPGCASCAVTLCATSLEDSRRTDSAQAITTKAPLSAVTLTTNPCSPKPAYTRITLQATSSGGGEIEYWFRVGYKDEGGCWQWEDLQRYNCNNTVIWAPTIPRTYTVVVYAREVGSRCTYTVYHSLNYRILPPPPPPIPK